MKFKVRIKHLEIKKCQGKRFIVSNIKENDKDLQEFTEVYEHTPQRNIGNLDCISTNAKRAQIYRKGRVFKRAQITTNRK